MTGRKFWTFETCWGLALASFPVWLLAALFPRRLGIRGSSFVRGEPGIAQALLAAAIGGLTVFLMGRLAGRPRKG